VKPHQHDADVEQEGSAQEEATESCQVTDRLEAHEDVDVAIVDRHLGAVKVLVDPLSLSFIKVGLMLISCARHIHPEEAGYKLQSVAFEDVSMHKHVPLVNLNHVLLKLDPVENVCFLLLDCVNKPLLAQIEILFSLLVYVNHLFIALVYVCLVFGVDVGDRVVVCRLELLEGARLVKVGNLFGQLLVPLIDFALQPLKQSFLFLHYNVAFVKIEEILDDDL
jgi:uncharacterized membrane protein